MAAAAPNRDQSVWNQFVGLSPGARAVSNFLDTLGLAANGATFGLGGGIVDALSGQQWGTSAHDARLRLNNSTNFNAGTAADVIGSVTGGKAAISGGRAAIGLARSGLGAVPVVLPRASTAAKFLLPGGAAIGLASMAGSGGDAAPAAAAPAVAPAPATVTSQPARAAVPTDYVTPRDRLSAVLDTVLSGPVSINQLRAVGGLVENTPRPQTTKNAVLGQTAQLSAQIFASQIASVQDQLANGQITEAQAQAAVQKATEARFARDAGLSGFNPTQLAQAQLLSPDEEQ